MVYTVYVLKDDLNRLYKGMTKNLSGRIAQHKNGHTITTAKMKNLRVAYTEEFDNFEGARKRELYFKSAVGRRFLKKKLGL